MDFKIIGEHEGQPTLDKPWDELYGRCVVGGCIKILSPLEYHTDRQRRWYQGPCITGLCQWNGDSRETWDRRLKKDCGGLKYLKREVFLTYNGTPIGRLTTKGVGKRNMTAFIEAILHEAMEEKNRWPITPPDADLRRSK